MSALQFQDWRSIRNAIEAAYAELGRPVPSNIPDDDWNFVGTAITKYEAAGKPKCLECKKPLEWHDAIRCLDCRAVLCEACAPRHFWPNGRPTQEHGQ